MNSCTKAIFESLLSRYPALDVCHESIIMSLALIKECYANGGKIITCGNGGSAADAVHIVGELMKSFCKPRKLNPRLVDGIYMHSSNPAYLVNHLQSPLEAISLVNETSLATAFANDVCADLGFAQQVLGYGKERDVLIAISTSGNSDNVIYACEVAKVKGLKIIGFTGKYGGALHRVADVAICVPETETFKVQELHLPIYHALCMGIESEMFGDE